VRLQRLARDVPLVVLLYFGANGLARLLGFGRETAIAYLFGASRGTDAYVAAIAVPELIAGALLSGLLAYAVIPAYLRLTGAGRPGEAQELIGAGLTQVLIWCGGLSVLSAVFADPVIRAVGPGLDGSAHADAVLMLRIASPAILFYGLGSLGAALLNARQRFLPLPVSIIAGNAVGIAVLVGLSSIGIAAAAAGYAVSGAIIALVQWGIFLHEPDHRLPRLVLRSPHAATILRAGTVATVITSVPFFRSFIERVIASTLESGDLASLNFATKLVFVPATLIAVSVGTVSFPRMAEQARDDDLAPLRETVVRSAAQAAALTLPFAVLFVFGASPVVRLIFNHGEFDEHNVHVTASILRLYGIGLIAMSVTEIMLRALFALKRFRLVLLCVTGTLGLNIVANIWLVEWLGVSGLGVGASVAVTLNAILLAAALRSAFRRQ
jgi:putative peptidoglycan lipid II flippase